MSRLGIRAQPRVGRDYFTQSGRQLVIAAPFVSAVLPRNLLFTAETTVPELSTPVLFFKMWLFEIRTVAKDAAAEIAVVLWDNTQSVTFIAEPP